MKEDFLHFIWQFSYFNTPDLFTTDGDKITIHKPGYWNHDAGPDFQEALIEIEGVRLAGSIEMHLKSSDWFLHHHEKDAAYKNVILHVLWEKNEEELNLPTLELKSIVDLGLIHKYQNLLASNEKVLCASQLKNVSSIVQLNMLDATLVERYERKTKEVLDLHVSNDNWSETIYQVLMRYMGFKVNNAAFLQLSNAIPLKVLLKHRDHLMQLEALLLGQSGMLEVVDEYSTVLKREYDFLSHKYGLKEKQMNNSQWKFLRLRPSNFPTIRLAQIAMVIHHFGDFTSKFLATDSVKGIQVLFHFGVSDYWRLHYKIGALWNKKIKGELGETSRDQLFTNVVVPLKMAELSYKGEFENKDEVLNLLNCIKPEVNKKVKRLAEMGFSNQNAGDSQSLMQLYDGYCSVKRCLQCKIGVSILKQ